MLKIEDKQQLFEELLSEPVYQSAWRFALSLAGSRHDAEDVLQDALIRAYRSLDRLRDHAKFTGWLLSTVRTTYLDHLRRERARPQVTGELPHYTVAVSTDPLSEALLEGLARLPKAQQQLLILFYLEGLSLNETGQALGIRVHAIRQRLFRARQALRRELQRCGSPASNLALPSQDRGG